MKKMMKKLLSFMLVILMVMQITPLELFAANSSKDAAEFAHAVLSNVDFWGQDLSAIAGLDEAVSTYLNDIRTMGMRAALEKTFA